MILIRAHGDEPAADGDAKIQQMLEGIYELRPGYVTVHGDWGDSVAVLRGVYSTRGRNYLPDRFAICTVDFINRKLTSVAIPGLKRITHLASDGTARVAAGEAEDKSWQVMRQNGEKWEAMELPEKVRKATLHRLIRSDGPLAIAIPDAIFRRTDGQWKMTSLPPISVPHFASIVVEADALLVGSTYYIGWWNQGDTTEGGFNAIDLDAETPVWRSIYGTDDPSKGFRESRAVVVLSMGPKGQIWVDAESDLDHARVYEFDGRRWHKRVDISAGLPDDPNGLANWGNQVTQEDVGDLRVDKHGRLHMLGPKGIFSLKDNKLVRHVPGPIFRPNSLYITDSGSFLVGTTMAGLLLFEKVEGGYKLSRLAYP